MYMEEASPEKAGVGGSIPSLATILFLDLPSLLSPRGLDSVSIHCTIPLKLSTTLRCDSGTNC